MKTPSKNKTRLKTFYFTFGFGQRYENGFYVIKARNREGAREEMIRKFGLKWAFQYTKEQWFDENGVSQQEKYNLREVK